MQWLHLHEITWLWLVVYVLAVFRLTSILFREKIGEWFRKLMGAKETEETIFYPDTFLGELISCFWCLSVWCGVGLLPFLLFLPEALLPFAGSTIAIILYEKVLHG
jgi:hypothetical protein